MTQYTNPSPELRARVALEKHGFHTSHSLGQNFLLDGAFLSALLDAAGVGPEDRVLEIGPGPGLMTALLAARCQRVLAVEVDRGLEPVLHDVLQGMENAEVRFEDILKSDLRSLMGEEPYRVVANLPYYITADVLLRLTTAPNPPESIAIMVQKEAADRITSSPGGKSWCALAATVQSYGAAEALADVPPEYFSPPPHVMSRFLLIRRHPDPVVTPADYALYLRVINAAFAMRRKTLLNNIKAAFRMDAETAGQILEAAGIDPRVRGEALPLEALARLSDVIGDRY